MIDQANEPQERLVVFSRYPEPGKTKTRLMPVLGGQGAADLHRQMAELAVVRAETVADDRPVSVEVRCEGGGTDQFTQWLGPHLRYMDQGDGGLGERMHRAFDDAAREGTERTVIVGTDCPGLTDEIIVRAFDLLRENDLVLGPAADGGYYLIGLRRPVQELFDGVPWGTAGVLRQTLDIAEDLGLSAALLDELRDVDRPEDIAVWETELAGLPSPVREALARMSMPISVVVPVLNEADNIGPALGSIDGAQHIEVIVADGGSEDGSREIAATCGAQVITSARGRARQMNAGAEAATGDILLFLHADTRLPLGFAHHVRQMLSEPGVVAGAFELGIDAPGRGLRAVERVANLRSRRLQLPYGDQALFLKAPLFRELGPFPDIPIMEDIELVRRLRRKGRVAIAPAAVASSARRWQKLGVCRTTFINWASVTAYVLGVDASRIARWYRRPDPV